MINLILLLLSALSLAYSQETCWAPSLAYGSRCISSKDLQGSENTFIEYYFLQMTPGVGANCYAMAMAPRVPGETCTVEWQYVGYITPSE